MLNPKLVLKRPVQKLSVISLLILLATSSLAQERRTVDPSRWDAAMERFAEQDANSPPPLGAIVLTGSSSIARWNNQAQEALAPLTVIPRGFGGSVMEDVLFHLDTVALQYKPRAILIYEGDNDTGLFYIPQGEILGYFNAIVATVHAASPDTRIYVMSVKPSLSRVAVWDKAQEVNASLKAIAGANSSVHYIDAATPFLQDNGKVMDDIFVEDGLHLNDKGNEIWGGIIKAALMPIEGEYE